MKIISDAQVVKHLLGTLSKESIITEYQPVLVAALREYEINSAIAPERTVSVSNTPGSDTTHLFMPCIAPHGVGLKVISGGPTNARKGLGFQGCLIILDEYSGELQAVVNAKSLTAFRTALASSVGLVHVFSPSKETEMLPEVLVFGAGPQAYWHVVLASRLYGDKILRFNIFSRSESSAKKVAEELKDVVPQPVFGFALASETIASHTTNSSIIFGCTPSTEGIIKASFINTDPKITKFILLIGSYKPHMFELDLDFVRENYTNHPTKIFVDSKSHTLAEAGELIKCDIKRDQLVSLTELDEVKASEFTTEGGVVLQKLVGLLIMDICMSKLVMEHIEGATVVEGF